MSNLRTLFITTALFLVGFLAGFHAYASDSEHEASTQTFTIDSREVAELALFANNSAEVSPNRLRALQPLFAKLAEFAGITTIKVTGHTSSRGRADRNQVLSERRAEVVARILSTRYPEARVTAVGKGEREPVANNDTAEGEARNRRVEIEIRALRSYINPRSANDV